MPPQAQVHPSQELDFDRQHVLLVAARHARAALLAIGQTLDACPGELCGLTLKPVGAIVEGVLRLKGLDDPAAERLADRLAQGLGVQSVRVEHQWGLK